MAEYIEREAVMKTAKDGNHSDFGRSIADLTSLREVLENTPAADVVEIVRCKDCKNYDNQFSVDNCGWCDEFNCGTSDERFCSYGERKEV